jgi:hypothetical protein
MRRPRVSKEGIIQVYDALYFASRELLTPSELMDSNGVLRRAMNLMDARRQMLDAPDPETELFIWWQHVRENLPSYRQFRRARKMWPFVTEKSHKAARSEYVALLDVIFAFPFSDTSEMMTERTRVLLANIVGIEPQSSDWNSAFSAYSGKLTPFFHLLRDNVPGWIERAITDLKVSNVIPFRTRDPVDVKEVLAASEEDTPLRRMISKVAVEWPKRKVEIAAESAL